jgi:GWxTD domain-containing protein
MKYIVILTISLLTFLPSTIISDTQLNFEYDYCVFKNDDTSSFVEFYYSFLQNELTFVKTSDGYELDGLINLQIVSNETGKEIFNQSFKTPMIVADTSGYNKNSSLMGQLNFILKKGTYRLVIKASDFNDSLKVFNAQDNISIDNFPAGISSSSLQLSTMITKSSNESDVFYKNSLEVIPNPSRIFGKNLSDVYYYVEFYNLSKASVSDGYSVVKIIKDLNNNQVKSGRTEYKLTGGSRIEYGHFNISDLATGNYYFEVLLQDSKNNALLEQKNKFWIYNTIDTNSTVLTTDDKYLLSEYKIYTQKQIDDEIEQISYIISDQFRNQLNNTTDLEGKRILLFNFWDKYDPNKSTTVNEFKVSYFEKIKYANKNFGSAFMLGWKTDRGRIYSVYGKPDEIERFPFGANEKAHEIWKYNMIEGGVEFVFVDLTNNGDNYQLVHSTKKDELSDEKWRDRLKIN